MAKGSLFSSSCASILKEGNNETTIKINDELIVV
jgi:hypothetical protein